MAFLRKLQLVAHVVSSIGWLGAVAAFLALAVEGLLSPGARTACAAYIAANVIGLFVIVPMSITSLLTGFAEAASTPWALLRHYWVLLKLSITIVSIVLLLVHMQPVTLLARAAMATPPSVAALGKLRVQLIADSSLALLALLANITLAMYKPAGLTPYGRRKQRESAGSNQNLPGATPLWVYLLVIAAVVLLVTVRYLTVGAAHMGR